MALPRSYFRNVVLCIVPRLLRTDSTWQLQVQTWDISVTVNYCDSEPTVKASTPDSLLMLVVAGHKNQNHLSHSHQCNATQSK